MARRRIWKALGLLGLTAASVTVAIGGAVAWLSTDSGNRWLGKQVLAVADAAIPGRLMVGSLDTNLLHHLELTDLALIDLQGEPVATAARVRLDYDLAGLLSRQLHVRDVQVEGLSVELDMMDDGQLDVLAAVGVEPSDTSEPTSPWAGIGDWSVAVDRIALVDGAFTYSDARIPDAPVHVVIPQIGLQAAATVAGDHVGVSRLRLVTDLDAPVDETLHLVFVGEFDAGDVVVNRLELSLNQSRVGASGRIFSVETAPVLALRMDVPELDSVEINRLVQQEVLSADLRLGGDITGPLDALQIAARLHGEPMGALDVAATADLTASPLTWSVGFETPRFDLQPLLPAITEPVVLDGRWNVYGSGTQWPDELQAHFKVAADAPVVWGEQLHDLQIEGDVAAGVVSLTRVSARHAVGAVTADGSVDVAGSGAVFDLQATVPSLGSLSRFGVDGAGGRASFGGTVRADWSAEPVEIRTNGQLRGSALALADQGVWVETLSVPLVATVVGRRVSARGGLIATGVAAPSAAIGELVLPSWTATWSQQSGVEVDAEIAARSIDFGDGAVVLASLIGTLGGGADGEKTPFADVDVIVSELLFGESKARADGGPVEMRLEGDMLTASFDLDRSADAFFEGVVSGDLGTSEWVVDDLVVAPTAGKPWSAPVPVTFVLADGGIRALNLALNGPSGGVIARGDWVGSTAAGTNLLVDVHGLLLADAAQIVQTYVPAEAGAPPLLEGLKGSLNMIAELSDGSRPDGVGLEIDLDITGLVYPGIVENVDLDAVVSGSVGAPEAVVRVSTGKSGELVVGTVAVPLRLVGGLPDRLACGENGRVELLLTPGNLDRITKVVPDLTLPEGRASAALVATGDVCDPDLDVTGSAEVVAGGRGQRARLDLQVLRDQETLTLAALGSEALARRVELTGTATTHLTERLREFLPQSLPEDEVADLEVPDLGLPSSWLADFDLSLVPVGLPLSTLALFAEVPPGVRGLIGGGVNLSGTPNSPVLAGALLLVDGYVGTVKLDQAQVMFFPGMSADTGEMGYQVESHVGFGAAGAMGQINLAGHVPLRLDLDLAADQRFDLPGLALKLDGPGLPLATLPGLVDGIVDAQGVLQVNGTVGGTVADPTFQLQANLDDGAVAAADLGIQFEDMKVALELDAERLSVNRMSMTTRQLYAAGLPGVQGNSKASLAGSVLFDQLSPKRVQLHLSATDFWLISNDDYSLRANGRIDAAGDWPAIAVTGNAELVQGRISLPDSMFQEGSSLALDPTISVHRKRAVQKDRDRGRSELMDNLTVDLDLDLRRGLQLRAFIPMANDYGEQFAELSSVGVDAELASQGLKVQWQGSDKPVVVNGTLEINPGELDIMGKSFDVGGGTTSFVGDVADPILDVSATHRTGSYGDITVDVGGSVSNLSLDFSSDQYADKTDVMAILVLGKPPSEMSDSEGQMGGALLSAALGSVASNLSRTVSSAFLGQIEIDADSFKVGFPVTRDVFGSFEIRSTEDEDENQAEVTLEWLLSRRLSAELVTGDAVQTSADLYYRWRF